MKTIFLVRIAKNMSIMKKVKGEINFPDTQEQKRTTGFNRKNAAQKIAFPRSVIRFRRKIRRMADAKSKIQLIRPVSVKPAKDKKKTRRRMAGANRDKQGVRDALLSD